MNVPSAIGNDFGTRLYDALAQNEAGRGLFLSPFSIHIALAMCAAGARGETRRVLVDLIDAPDSITEQNQRYAASIERIHRTSATKLQLSTANALWVQQGYRLHPEYQKAIAEFYSGVCNTVDFQSSPEEAATRINAWVEKQTAGKIRDLISRQLISRDTHLILTNAIYFKAKWANPFDPSHTWEEDWQGPNGIRQAPMMHQRGEYRYCEGKDYQALDLPYLGEQLSLLVVLPLKSDGLTTLERQWATGKMQTQVAESLAEEEVIVSLPRFRFQTEYRLKDVLCGLGAAVAFGDSADFTGISAQPLKISEVIHKAFIEVDEAGTEAAAATGVAMAKCSAPIHEPKSFVADHPFLFFIRDRQTNAVLFAGRVMDP